jgi:hypothetical protein
LDYFKGDQPEVATVQVEAGLSVRTYTVSMPSEYYGSEHYPVHLTSIKVIDDPNDGVSFQIIR